MKSDYKLKICFGSVYSGGNISFSGSGSLSSTLTSIYGNRLVKFDLKHSKCHSVDNLSDHTLTCFDVSPNNCITVVVNENGSATLVSNQSELSIRSFDFRSPVSAVSFSPDGSKIAVAKNDVILVYHAPGMYPV